MKPSPLSGLLPEHASQTYAPVGRCIYCQATDHLHDEHIIPLGLGGRHVLPKASCKRCGGKTSAFERTCQRTMYGPLRLLYGLPSRRQKDRPETLPLKVKRSADAEWEYIQVPQSRFPFLFTFPYWGMPGVMSGEPSPGQGPATKRMWIRGASPGQSFDALCREVAAELHMHSIMPESKADMEAFSRMLSKIAYAHAVARRGGKTIQSPLVGYATGGAMAGCLRYIGGRDEDEPAAAALHEINLAHDPEGKLTVVRIRLLACFGTPTYYVVVHDAEERANSTQQPTGAPSGADG